MLTEHEITQAIDRVPITRRFATDVARAVEAAVLAKLPKADLLLAAEYLEGDEVSMPAVEADRIAAVLRELAR